MQAVDDNMKEILSELMRQSYLADYYLVGGTNLALRYGHRTSIDIDLFAFRNFDNNESYILNNHLKDSFGKRFVTNSINEAGIFGFLDDIKVDFVNYPFKLLERIENLNGIRMANSIDIGAMKVKAIIGRGSRKDFYDLYFLLQKYPLLHIMKAFQKKYKVDNVGQARIALTYFEDAEDSNKRDNKFLSLSNVKWETVKKEITKALKQMDSDMAVQLAVKFHKENDYLGKDGDNLKQAIKGAFKEEFGKILSNKELEMISKTICKEKK